jgi:sugar O-acyltransferase (sialic acid O-acetyltransferase NeuD family)
MNVVIYGGTGQAKVVRSILTKDYITAIIDDTRGLQSPFNDVPIYCGLDEYRKVHNEPTNFVVAIGNPNGEARENIAIKLIKHGWTQIDVISSQSIVQKNTTVGTGVQIHPGAIIMTDTKIGNNCIVNTGAIVEHDCILGNNVEIGPGATVAGQVTIGKNTWIGAGATVIDKLNIGKNVIVGAGATVTKDVPNNIVVVGTPAKFLRNTDEG